MGLLYVGAETFLRRKFRLERDIRERIVLRNCAYCVVALVPKTDLVLFLSTVVRFHDI